MIRHAGELHPSLSIATREKTKMPTPVTPAIRLSRDRDRIDHHNHEDLLALAGKLLTVQDEERRRISRDLHDDVNQRLGALGLELDSLCRNLPIPTSTMRRRIRAIRRRIGELSDDVRQLAYQFHQTTVEDLGLIVALQRYLNDFVKRTGIKARFLKPRSLAPIPLHLATCLYRIVQESLGNVGLHAKASQVTVEFAVTPDTLSVCVRDNGIGMDFEKVRRRTTGLGMLSMRERVRMVNGSLEWHSQPGQGTEIVARLPVHMEGP